MGFTKDLQVSRGLRRVDAIIQRAFSRNNRLYASTVCFAGGA